MRYLLWELSIDFYHLPTRMLNFISIEELASFLIYYILQVDLPHISETSIFQILSSVNIKSIVLLTIISILTHSSNRKKCDMLFCLEFYSQREKVHAMLNDPHCISQYENSGGYLLSQPIKMIQPMQTFILFLLIKKLIIS